MMDGELKHVLNVILNSPLQERDKLGLITEIVNIALMREEEEKQRNFDLQLRFLNKEE